jgi:hypothetical protein
VNTGSGCCRNHTTGGAGGCSLKRLALLASRVHSFPNTQPRSPPGAFFLSRHFVDSTDRSLFRTRGLVVSYSHGSRERPSHQPGPRSRSRRPHFLAAGSDSPLAPVVLELGQQALRRLQVDRELPPALGQIREVSLSSGLCASAASAQQFLACSRHSLGSPGMAPILVLQAGSANNRLSQPLVPVVICDQRWLKRCPYWRTLASLYSVRFRTKFSGNRKHVWRLV